MLGGSGRLDLDLLLLLLRFDALRKGDRQDALGALGGDLVAVDALRQREGALECAIGALRDVPVLVLLLLLLPLLALDRKDVTGERNLDILFVEAWQFGRDLERLLVLDHVDRGRVETEGLVERACRLEDAPQRRHARAGKSVEQTIDLAAEAGPWIARCTRRRRLLDFSGCNGHRQPPQAHG